METIKKRRPQKMRGDTVQALMVAGMVLMKDYDFTSDMLQDWARETSSVARQLKSGLISPELKKWMDKVNGIHNR